MHPTIPLRIAFACAAALLSGCDSLLEDIAPCSDGHCRPPVEAISEMRALGVTLTSSSRPFPDESEIDVDVRVREDDGERFVSSYLLDLYFSPAEVFETVPDPDSLANDWADHPYAFRFSREADGAYEPIKPIIPSNAFLFEGTTFGPLAVTDSPSELVASGNHVLQATSEFPERATHVELWFRTEREREFALMRRVALDSLIAWRRYLRDPAREASHRVRTRAAS